MKDYIKENFLSLIIIALCLCILFFLIPNQNSEKPLSGEKERVYLYDSPAAALSADSKDKLKNALSDSSLNLDEVVTDEFFNLNGQDITDLHFVNQDLTLALSDIDSPIVIQVVSDWCSWCIDETKNTLDTLVETHPDTRFIQYMASGGQNEIDNFYTQIGKKPNPNVFVAYSTLEVNELFKNIQMSYPCMIFVNSEHKITGYFTGSITAKTFDTLYTMCNSINTYELTTQDGDTLLDFINKKEIARNYINKLEYIDVPKEEFE